MVDGPDFLSAGTFPWWGTLSTLNSAFAIDDIDFRKIDKIPPIFDDALIHSGLVAFQIWISKSTFSNSKGYRWSAFQPGSIGRRYPVKWKNPAELNTPRPYPQRLQMDNAPYVCWQVNWPRSDGSSSEDYPCCILWLHGDSHADVNGSFVGALAGILRSRISGLVRMFRGFPEEYVTRYFLNELNLPQNFQQVWTVTLSIDYRKSTFAMERAINRTKFARWITKSVDIFRNIVTFNGGIFDKFTGDGLIAHFRPAESALFSTLLEANNIVIRAQDDGLTSVGNGDADREMAATLAVGCAFELTDASMALREELKDLVFFDSQHFGAGVGIGVGNASWSCDQDGQPQVVGHGLVDAVRTSDKAKGGTILITQHVLTLAKALASEVINSAHAVSFDSKDLRKETGAIVYHLRDRPRWIRSRNEIINLCKSWTT